MSSTTTTAMSGQTNAADPNAGAGSAQGGGSSSLSGMLSTLLPTGLLALVYLILFLLFRSRIKRIYQPRTYIGELQDKEKTPKNSPGMFAWLKEFWSLPDTYVLSHHSLDGYLWLRYFKMLTIICFVGLLITWPILFPVYATSPPNPANPPKQFDYLNIGMVSKTPVRTLAPCLVSWVLLTIVLAFIGRESLFFVRLRQAYLLSPYISSRMSTRTVLFTDVPDDYLNEVRLRATFPGVKHVWMVTDAKELEDLVEDRDKTAMKLEAAEVKLASNANKKRIKAKGAATDSEDPMYWVDQNKRPSHKLKPLIGQKVDTIDWSRSHLQEVIPKIEAEQSKHWQGQAKYVGACFVEFDTVQAAEAAFQSVVWHTPKQFQPRAIGTTPDSIIWKNLGMSWWQRDLRSAGANAFIALLIIFWAIPVAFVGFVSNINYLAEKYSWLAWIKSIPPQVLGVVTGLLPVVLLAVLMALVPIIIAALMKMAGAASYGEVALKTQNWYFWFQVVQVFLITTLSSGASTVISQITSNPGSAPSLLANGLPKASNFYINYFVLQGIPIAAGIIVNIVGLVIYFLLGTFLDNTPRKKFRRYTTLSGIAWGAIYPKFTNMGVIAITYSTIAPLVLGFACLCFLFIYHSYRYALFYVMDTSGLNTQGRSYSLALRQLLVGVYLSEICLIGLFGINAGTGPVAAASLVLMVIFLIFTILFNIYLNGCIKHLSVALPIDLLSENTRIMGRTQPSNTHGQEVVYNSAPDGNNTEKNLSNGHSQPYVPTQLKSGPKGWLYWLLHPQNIPDFAPFFNDPLPDYPGDVRREAYLDPAITSPTPLLWIPHDNMGISTHEKEQSGKVIGVSDAGAWFDEKGKIRTVWEGEAERGEENLPREAPIYEDKPKY